MFQLNQFLDTKWKQENNSTCVKPLKKGSKEFDLFVWIKNKKFNNKAANIFNLSKI